MRVPQAIAGCGLVLVCGAPGVAAAHAPVRLFVIPRQPLGTALVRFSLQAQISIGGISAARCGGPDASLFGAYSIAGGLQRLLAHSRCTVRMIDPVTAQIVLRPPPPVDAPLARVPTRPAVPAQEAAAEELVVTATRRPALIDELPAAATVLSGTGVFVGRATTTRDLTPQLAGVTATNLGPGRNKIIIRGLSDGPVAGRGQSAVAIYLDDARLTFNAPDPDLRLADVQRIEVLRGPQGALYGAGAIGGILQIVTRRPDLDTRSAELTGELAATHGGGASKAIDGVVNLPIVAGRLAVRAVGYDEIIGGYLSNPRLSLDHANATRRAGGRLTATYEVGSRWSVTAGLVHQSLFAHDSQYTFAGQPPLVRTGPIKEPHDNDFDEAHVTIEGEVGQARLRWSSAVLRHDLSSVYNASEALPAFGAAPGPVARFDDLQHIRTFVNEASLQSSQPHRARWLVGAFASIADDDGRAALSETTGPNAGRQDYTEAREDRVSEYAVFGDLSYALTPRLDLTAGARVFGYSLSTQSLATQPGRGAAVFSGHQREAGASPLLQLSWRPHDWLAFYLQASEGYRPGGFNTRGVIGQTFSSSEAGPQPYRAFRADQLWNYEAGAKLALFEQRLRVRSAVFHTVWSDLQAEQVLGSGLTYTANIGDGQNLGFEGEVTWEPSDRLRLAANLLVNDPELVRVTPGFNASADNPLPGVSRLSFGAVAAWTWLRRGSVTVGSDVEFSHLGESRLTLSPGEATEMGDYSTLKLSTSLALAHTRLSAFVDNPFDWRQNTFAFGNPFVNGGAGQSTPLRPMTVGVVVSQSF